MTGAILMEGGAIRLPLPSELDMKAASPLKAALAECRGRDVELDGSAVTRLGGQCLQVVLAAVRDWAVDGRSLSIVSPSVALVDHLEMLGVRPAPHTEEIAA